MKEQLIDLLVDQGFVYLRCEADVQSSIMSPSVSVG